MRVKSIIKNLTCIVLLLIIGVTCLAGCGESDAHFGKSKALPTEGNSTSSDKTDNNICIIQELNMLEENITVYNIVTNRVMRYKYSLATRFLDKYGQESSSLNFTPGTAVVLGDKLPTNALSVVKMSDKTWKQDGVTNYTISPENHKMTIGSAEYQFNDNICVYSGAQSISILSVGKSDTLTVVGKDNNILSIAVTTGHGYIQFINSENFIGSMVQIGSNIFAKITPDILVEVPEGTYNVTVANNGFGGTVQCNVTKGEISVIDLGEIQRGGPKTSQITFVSATPGVAVFLDGNQVNPNEPQVVPYGMHHVKVTATGYNDWSRTLYVNSPSAKIAIDMSDESSTPSNNTTTVSKSKKNTTNATNSSSAVSNDVDYLSTLSNMISTITGNNSST